MPKNNNRETITLGQPTLAEIKAKLEKQVDKTVRTQSEIAKLAATTGPNRLAELIERETAALHARADVKERALFEGGYGMQVCPACNGTGEQSGKVCPTCAGTQLTERRADPGDIVGLDEATPDSDAAVNGDSKGTDPNAG